MTLRLRINRYWRTNARSVRRTERIRRREALSSVRQMESYLNITAPFDGIVTTRNLHPGALIGPASGQGGSPPILQIVDDPGYAWWCPSLRPRSAR